MVENKGKPPVFCEKFCIVCKGAREGNKICKAIQNIELKIFGKNGCIWGAARTKYYGITPDKKLTVDSRINIQNQNRKNKIKSKN